MADQLLRQIAYWIMDNGLWLVAQALILQGHRADALAVQPFYFQSFQACGEINFRFWHKADEFAG